MFSQFMSRIVRAGATFFSVAAAVGILFQGSASSAQAAFTVDLKVTTTMSTTTPRPNGDVTHTFRLGRNGATSSAGRLTILYPTAVSNVRTSIGGSMLCANAGQTSFFGSPANKIVCTASNVSDQTYQLTFAAPGSGTWGVMASVEAVNATDSNTSNNQGVGQFTVTPTFPAPPVIENPPTKSR